MRSADPVLPANVRRITACGAVTDSPADLNRRVSQELLFPRDTCRLCSRRAFRTKLHAPDLLAADAKRYAVWECVGCGLLATEIPAGTDRYPFDYYRRFPEDRGAENRSARRLDTLRIFRRRGRALDVGCGTGAFLDALSAAGWKACGTEVNRGAVDRLRNRGHCVTDGMLVDQGFPAGHFDAVSYVGTFEHVPTPREELREVRRILRPGGALILNVTDAGSAEARLLRATWVGYEVPRHCFNYTKQTVTWLLRSEGFEILNREEQWSTFITGYSLANALGLRSRYGRLAPVLERMTPVEQWVSAHLGLGNLLEVTARRSA